jgi:hypothetical protein
MVSLAEYFSKNRYKAKYDIGDRVIGKWNKIPFVGSVGNDTLINESEGPRISIHLDLPIKYANQTHTVIIVKHKDVRRLPEIKDEDGTSSKKRVAPSRKTVQSGNRRSNPK